MESKYLDHSQVVALAVKLSTVIRQQTSAGQLGKRKPVFAYPIPRGGVPVAYLLKAYVPGLELTGDPAQADFFVDDIIDSGATCERYCDQYPGKPFFTLIDKRHAESPSWVVFPWEQYEETSVTDSVVRMLQFIGEDPKRGGLLETPARVVKAWKHWFGGYDADISKLLKVFEDGAENCDEMIVRVVPFYSHCEHHIAAIIGHAVVAYIPNGKVVGLSKIDRVVDAFARRLQVQERLTNQIASAIMDNLQPKGVGVWIKARHLCVESRGVRNQNSETDSLALRGVFRDDARTRAEFLMVAHDKVK